MQSIGLQHRNQEHLYDAANRLSVEIGRVFVAFSSLYQCGNCPPRPSLVRVGSRAARFHLEARHSAA